MNKFIQMLVVLFIGFVVIATATIVDYLSNPVSITGDVESPFSVEFSNSKSGSPNGNSWELGTISAGSIVTGYVIIQNNADQPIDGSLEMQCFSDNIPNCDNDVAYETLGVNNCMNGTYILESDYYMESFTKTARVDMYINPYYVGEIDCIIQVK